MIEIASNIPETTPNYRVPALEKGLDILELLAGLAHGLTLKELAEQLERTSQEIFRPVSALVARGYLLRDGAGKYRVSTKLFELGTRHDATQALIARAMPHMQSLADGVAESCHLSILVQDHMLVVARAECSADVKMVVRVGATFAMHARVSGRVALAALTPQQQTHYWQQHPLPPAELAACQQEVQTIAAQGYAAADSPIIVGGRDYAAAVKGNGGVLLGVLCLSRLSRVGEPQQGEKYIQAVLNCAQAICSEFGLEPLE